MDVRNRIARLRRSARAAAAEGTTERKDARASDGGDGMTPGLELFATERTVGWDAFGNDARLWAQEVSV
jgi:hypothetical protein